MFIVRLTRNKKRMFEGFSLSMKERLEFAGRITLSPTMLGFFVFGTIWTAVLEYVFPQVSESVILPVVKRLFGSDQAAGNPKFVSLFLLPVILLVTVMGPYLLCFVVFAKRIVPRSRIIMRQMGFPICVKCGYNLTGLDDAPTDDHCPECGASLDEMVPVGKRKNTPEK